jgi:hypothetical protein
MKGIKLLSVFLFVTNFVYSQIVHVTKTGSKYHTDDCRYLWNSNYILSLKKALEIGYNPCKVCDPPLEVRKKKKSQKIHKNYPINNQNVTRYYINDKQVTEKEYNEYKSPKPIIGIGASIKSENGLIIVTGIAEDSPLNENKKLNINDIILKVNDISVTGLKLENVIQMIRGEEGSEVNLTVKRPSGRIHQINTYRYKIGEISSNRFIKDYISIKLKQKLQEAYDTGLVDGKRLYQIKIDSLIKIINNQNKLIDSLK